MKNLKLFVGYRKWGKETIYITPTVYTTVLNSKFEERHSFSIEFQWILFGAGIKIFWTNKNVDPYTNLDFLIAP